MSIYTVPIYLDHNATTPLSGPARSAMTEAMDLHGNPSSAHRAGRKARESLEKARELVATSCGVEPSEIVFTSGGSEANGLALLGSYFARGGHFRLLTSTVEHSSIRDLQKWMEERGVQVRTLPVDPTGALGLEAFEETIKTFRPHLVSVMAANNETGVLFPVAELARICHANGALLHTDAIQALGKVGGQPWKDADFVSISAHKIGGPKGVGALVVRSGRTLAATHFGGSQETKRRGGTENLLGIVGFGAACGHMADESELLQVETLRDRMERQLVEAIGDLQILGKASPRLGNTSCVRIPGIPAEILLGVLDMEGIAVSAGSACSSGSISPSHVVLAMGLNRDEARECLRVSLGRASAGEEVDTFVAAMINHTARIRSRKRDK